MSATEQVEGLIPRITQAVLSCQDAKKKLDGMEQEMEKSLLFQKISLCKKVIQDFEKEEKELREQGKQIMLDNGLKKFEMIDWTVVQLNSTPWSLVIAEWVQLDSKYYKEKTTVTMDKVLVKKDFMEWKILNPGVTIESEYKFLIKQK